MFMFYLFALALAVFAAWLYGRSTDRVIAETNKETEVVKNENLKLRRDLDAETGKVAGLQKDAAEAQRLLSEQQGKTAKLEQDAADAKTALSLQEERAARAESQLAGLQKDAADSKAAQQRVEIDLANARTEAAKAIENERATRLKLEESLEPWVITITQHSVAELRLFSGTHIIISVADDPEARDLAQQLVTALGPSEWQIKMTNQPLDGVFMQGVRLLTRTAGRPDDAPAPAAELLAIQLRDNHIQAVHHGALDVWPRSVPNDWVIISIGRRPSPYFDAKREREWINTLPEDVRKKFERVEDERERTDKIRREYDQEQRRRIIGDAIQRP
ncbi:MAG: hypothetical protein QOF62_1214 [Pyrinomonadaceae bacterium]|jgi:hypothetical protein|nr:hypothetical protein [Pyrinomonadaceae bacterium]